MNYTITIELVAHGEPYELSVNQYGCTSELDAALKAGVSLAHIAGARKDNVTLVRVVEKVDD